MRPQPGPQEAFLTTPVDIGIYGGAAGCGKTHALLTEGVRYQSIPEFRAVIFRRTSPEITNAGGLKDNSEAFYYKLGGDLNLTTLKWTFPSGARVELAHLQHDKDKQGFDGAQIPLVMFDQLESFTESMFWYMQSRNRDPSGKVRPYLRASCNPVPGDDPIGGWLRHLIDWWIGEDGLPIPERSGVVRWFYRGDDGAVVWADSAEELREENPDCLPLSFTFIPGRLEDNPALTSKDPLYRAKLMNLPPYERARLLGGNWNAKPAAGKVFDRAKFVIVDAAPVEVEARVRAWDKAATELKPGQKKGKSGDPDFSAGVRMSIVGGIVYVEDDVRGRWKAHDRNQVMLQTARDDGMEVEIWVEQEPGSGGKESAELTVQQLAGYSIRTETVSGDKVTRAGPFAAQVQAGNVRLVSGPWNKAYLDVHHNFPEGAHDDDVDASSLAYNKLALKAGGIRVGVLGGGGSKAKRRVTLTG